MVSPQRFLRSVLLFDLLLIGFAIARGIWRTGNPGRYFGEGRFVTFFSCAQLLGVAALAFLTFQARRRGRSGPMGTTVIWLLAASGFVFLACDEGFSIHEKIDQIIHHTLRIKETPLTDRLDDMIIAAYGLAGLVTMWICRRELLPFRTVMTRPLAAGFICLGFSVLCDTVSNDDVILMKFLPEATAKRVNPWFSAGDGAFTVLAEGMFLGGFYAARHRAASEEELVTA